MNVCPDCSHKSVLLPQRKKPDTRKYFVSVTKLPVSDIRYLLQLKLKKKLKKQQQPQKKKNQKQNSATTHQDFVHNKNYKKAISMTGLQQ